MQGSDQQDHSGLDGHLDGGGNIKEDRKLGFDILVGREDETRFFRRFIGDITFAVWGIAGVGKSTIVRCMYSNYEYIKMKGWVDVPHPFNLTDLCRRLLLDLYSDDVDTKETAAIGMLEGQDPIEGCCKILRQNKCLLVIDGLRSTHDWDLLKATLLSQPISGMIIVITCEESIATHCAHAKQYILNVNGLEADVALDLFKEVRSLCLYVLSFPYIV